MKQQLLILKRSGICALLMGLITLSAHAQEKITLQRAVDLALQNNLSVKQSAFTEALDAATLQQSKNDQLPNLSSTIQARQNLGRSIDASTNQFNKNYFLLTPNASAQVTLFQGGQLRNIIIQNRLLVDADKSATAKIKNDLVLNVIIDYLQILTNADLVTAAKQQIDIANINLGRTQKTVKAGNQTLADLSQAQANLSTSQLNLTTAQNSLDLSLLILKQYMEMPPSTPITVEKPDISKISDSEANFNAEDIIATALHVNPDVKLAEAQQATYAQAIKVARGYYFPTLSIFGNLTSNYSSNAVQLLGYSQVQQQIGVVDGTNTPVNALIQQGTYGSYAATSQLTNNFSQSVGVTLSIPIFNRFNAHTQVKRATISYQNAEISTRIAKNNLSKTIYQAVLDARAAANQYQSSQQTYQANKDAFNVIQLRYNEGLVNSLDYNTSLTNLNKSQNDLILAHYQMIFRAKVIDYYLGKPIIL